jgi:hypothetical protein
MTTTQATESTLDGHPSVDVLPHWPDGTIGVLATVDNGPDLAMAFYRDAVHRVIPTPVMESPSRPTPMQLCGELDEPILLVHMAVRSGRQGSSTTRRSMTLRG